MAANVSEKTNFYDHQRQQKRPRPTYVSGVGIHTSIIIHLLRVIVFVRLAFYFPFSISSNFHQNWAIRWHLRGEVVVCSSEQLNQLFAITVRSIGILRLSARKAVTKSILISFLNRFCAHFRLHIFCGILIDAHHIALLFCFRCFAIVITKSKWIYHGNNFIALTSHWKSQRIVGTRNIFSRKNDIDVNYNMCVCGSGSTYTHNFEIVVTGRCVARIYCKTTHTCINLQCLSAFEFWQLFAMTQNTQHAQINCSVNNYFV